MKWKFGKILWPSQNTWTLRIEVSPEQGGLPCSGTLCIVKHKSTSAVWLALPSQTAICATKCRKDHSRCGYLNAGFCHHRLHSRFSSCPQYYIQFFTPVLYTVAFSIRHIWEHEFYCLDHLGSHGINRKFLQFCFKYSNFEICFSIFQNKYFFYF